LSDFLFVNKWKLSSVIVITRKKYL